MRRFGIILSTLFGAAVVLAVVFALSFGLSGILRTTLGIEIGGATSSAGDGDSTGNSGSADAVDDDELGALDVYRVTDDAELDPSPTADATEVWEIVVRMVGDEEAASEVASFRLADAASSTTLAYVEEAKVPGEWNLVVNLGSIGGDEELLFATLIHEWAHVFSLAPEQFTGDENACDTMLQYEGCAGDDSYLWQFYDTFWSDYTDAPDIENYDEDVAWEFYQQHEEDFVSDYAATNPSEDFAESFMTYVLESNWSDETTVGAKLAFFDQFPELAQLRADIRAEFSGEFGLP